VPALDNAGLFRQFADLLPFGAYIADSRKKVVYWNRRAEQISGYLSHEVVGHSCADSILDHCAPGGTGICNSDLCPLARVLRDGTSAEARLLLRHKEGHRVPVLVRALPLRDENGKIVAVGEVFQEETVGADGLCWITEHIDRFDPEMGLPSEVASRAQLQLSLSLPQIPAAVFLIAINHLRDHAHCRGREMVNVALRNLAQTTSRLLNMPHYLGLWTDSRLLAVVPHCSPDLMMVIARTLEDTASCCEVSWWGERVAYQASVHATMIEPDETLGDLLRRLDPETAGAP
jgi:PAS domain S-box-containing protein